MSNYIRNRIIACCALSAALLATSTLLISGGCSTTAGDAGENANGTENAESAEGASENAAGAAGAGENAAGTSANAGAEATGTAGTSETEPLLPAPPPAPPAPPSAAHSPALPPAPARFIWPTPLPITATTPALRIAQAAASGDPATGLFGNARNNGWKFHEGLDIRPAARDKRGEPTDTVCAALNGIVAHIAPHSNGDYGRYVVLRHTEPGLNYYTLYAHLRSVSPALRLGSYIAAGTDLGVMGRSDGTARGFPKTRAHLHFEIGVRISPNFAQWYRRRQKSKSDTNHHGAWNGLNLYALDPLPFMREGLRTGTAPSLLEQIRREPTAVTVFVNNNRVPAIVRENPALLGAPLPATIGGWKIELAWHGMPLRLTPLASPPSEKIQITNDTALIQRARARNLLTQEKRTGKIVEGRTLQAIVSLLFE